MIYFTKDTLAFLNELKDNNNREWFNENKPRYEEHVKVPYQNFIGDLIDALEPEFPSLAITPKDAIFRIYRDVRFGKDKSPYKTKVSAIITPGGRKDMTSVGLYNELSGDGFRIYSGLFRLDAQQLRNVRTHISYNMDDFASLIANKKFIEAFGEIRGEKNKRLSKEFVEDAEKQPLLFNKSFYYFNIMDAQVVLKEGLIDRVIKTFAIAKPLSEFLKEGLDG
jgi:uncharacterized protein (TIGR02453 family)